MKAWTSSLNGELEGIFDTEEEAVEARRVSSVLGLIPAPFMAVYAATKHAIEGYSESVDHELREHGVRMLLVEPAYTSTSFEASSLVPDSPSPIYAAQREISRDVLATAVRNADDPKVVAKVIVTAATNVKPKVQYTAGSMAGRVSLLRRIVPASAFDDPQAEPTAS
jgi:short-subunit dehydrogenase